MAILSMHVGNLLVQWQTHVLANLIKSTGARDPLFVATDADRSDCIHMALGALQQ